MRRTVDSLIARHGPYTGPDGQARLCGRKTYTVGNLVNKTAYTPI
jgi:hypothetical protein